MTINLDEPLFDTSDEAAEWLDGWAARETDADTKACYLGLAAHIRALEAENAKLKRELSETAIDALCASGEAQGLLAENARLRDATLEEAARECDKEAAFLETAGKKQPSDSVQRDRCFAKARTAFNIAAAIRALKGLRATPPGYRLVPVEPSEEYHYTKQGRGIIDAVCKMFENGTFILGEGDALIPVQDAYKAYRAALAEAPKPNGGK